MKCEAILPWPDLDLFNVAGRRTTTARQYQSVERGLSRVIEDGRPLFATDRGGNVGQ